MSIRRAIVEADPSTMNVTLFCRTHGISTWFFWDLRRRFAAEGAAALEPRSRSPLHVANKTPVAIEDLIVAKRKELTDTGLDAGPASIAYALRDVPGIPSESTIWRRLVERGFVTPDPSKAPKRAGRRFNAARANESWQLDDTTWALADGTEAKIFNTIDDHSRLLVTSTAMPTCTGARAFDALAQAASIIGWPARIQSDNATAFRHVLADALAPLGIAAVHSRPHHPQTNGKVERFHQTLKRRLTALPAPASLAELQTQLDEFHLHYNHQRPHRGINRQPPATAWTNAPKTGPADRPLTTATTTYRSVVSHYRIRVGNHHVVTVGAGHEGHTAIAIVTGLDCHVFIDGRLIRHLTIDPSRRTQPLHPQTPTVREDPRHP